MMKERVRLLNLKTSNSFLQIKVLSRKQTINANLKSLVLRMEEQKKEKSSPPKAKFQKLIDPTTNDNGDLSMTSYRSNNESENDDVDGFFFESSLGRKLELKIEYFDYWKSKNILKDKNSNTAGIIEFLEWDDPAKQEFRTGTELRNINKNIFKKLNKGRIIENLEENLIRFDVDIEGFEIIRGVPIEIAGKKSYPLRFLGETKKQAKKRAYHISLIVDVNIKSSSKIVSFESQVKFTNNTLYHIKIAKVMNSKCEQFLSKEELDTYQSKQIEEMAEFGHDLHELIITIYSNDTYNIPIDWILDDSNIYYECKNGEKVEYRLLIKRLKLTFFKNDYEFQKAYDEIPKYNMLEQQNINNIFFGFDINKLETKPTSLKLPPQFECLIRPTV